MTETGIPKNGPTFDEFGCKKTACVDENLLPFLRISNTIMGFDLNFRGSRGAVLAQQSSFECLRLQKIKYQEMRSNQNLSTLIPELY